MGWLFDNVLANMQGPDFLAVYAMFAITVLVCAHLLVAAQDATGGRPPPVPATVDPYELAYLRGGVNEIIRTAVYALRQQGLVEIADGANIRATGYSAQQINPIERAVFGASAPAPRISALFGDPPPPPSPPPHEPPPSPPEPGRDKPGQDAGKFQFLYIVPQEEAFLLNRTAVAQGRA